MSVTLVQSTAYTGTVSQTNMTFTLSTTPVVGNILYVTVGYYTGDNPFVVPSGWTLERKDENGQVGLATIRRAVIAGDGTSWNLTVLTVADQNSGFMYELSNYTIPQPVLQSSNNSVTIATTSVTSTSITPIKVGVLALAFTVTIVATTGDVAAITAGWTKLQFANSTFQPAWMWRLTAITTDNAAIVNTVSSLPSAQAGTTVLLFSSAAPSFKSNNLRPHPFSPGLAR